MILFVDHVVYTVAVYKEILLSEQINNSNNNNKKKKKKKNINEK